jgi:AmiR/NasT family two-component response regulator
MGKKMKKIDRAKEILMTKLDISEKEALATIKTLSTKKNLDTDKTCDVLIQLENIIDPKWFHSALT